VKRHNQHCTDCAWDGEIVVAPFVNPPCPECGGATERWWPIGATTHSIISDEIIGGQWLENLGDKPVFVESKSQYRRELAARGLEQKVRHVGHDGGDRCKETQRWV
jgi:hypothetical protein